MQLVPRRSADLRGVIVTWIAAAAVFLLIHRLIFLAIYLSSALQLELRDGAARLIPVVFFIGFRFDLATLPLWAGAYIFLLLLLAAVHSFLRTPPVVFRVAALSLFQLQWLWTLWLHLLSVSSTYNYSVNGKHLGWEFAAYFKDLPVLLAGSFQKDPLPATLLVLFIPAWIFLGVWLDRRLLARSGYGKSSSNHEANHGWQKSAGFAGAALLWVLLCAVLFRGGFQDSPLRPGDAMQDSSPYLNNLKLNGVYTIAHDVFDRGDFKIYYPINENILYTQGILDDGRPFINPAYPLLRRMEARRLVPGRFQTAPLMKGDKPRTPNVVVLLMESWSARFLETHGYSSDVAPNFNRLAKEGVFFQNFYASGGRSANGIFSILSGIPDRAGRTILRSSKILNRFGGLPDLLAHRGYHTLFVHGGDLHFDNLDTALPHLGFQTVAGMKEMESSGLYSRRWTMGFHDEDTFDMLLRKMDESHRENPGRPFFAMSFSSNTHHPFALPDPAFEYFDRSDPEAIFKNAYRYSDHAVGRFVEALRKRPYFADTILVIVADHSHHANLDYLQDREIPLLVYAPAFFAPEERRDIAGQLDLYPTLLSLAGGDSPYAGMGRDLTAGTRNGEKAFAFFAGGSNTDIIGVVQSGFIYYNYLKSQRAVLLKGTPPAELVDRKAEQMPLFHSLDLKGKHYYQFARYLEQENLVWPPVWP